jgi:hypothetical protein
MLYIAEEIKKIGKRPIKFTREKENSSVLHGIV